MWSTTLSMNTSGIHPKIQKCKQNTNREQTGVPDQWKKIYRTTQGVLVGLDLSSAGGGNEAGVQSPH